MLSHNHFYKFYISLFQVKDPMDYPWNSPGQNTGMGSCSLFQRSNPGLPHCRRILYHLSHKGSPRILEWVVYPFSSRSSWPRNWSGVSCIAGGFFTNWAIREALSQGQTTRKQLRQEYFFFNSGYFTNQYKPPSLMFPVEHYVQLVVVLCRSWDSERAWSIRGRVQSTVQRFCSIVDSCGYVPSAAPPSSGMTLHPPRTFAAFGHL